jgi:hypothetical protein
MTTINTPDFKRIGTVGVLGPSTELKLQGMDDQRFMLMIQMCPISAMLRPLIRLKVRSGFEEPIYLRGMSNSIRGERTDSEQLFQAGGAHQGDHH